MSVLAAKVEHLFGVLLRDLRAPASNKGLTEEEGIQLRLFRVSLDFLSGLDRLERWTPDEDGENSVSIQILRGQRAYLPASLWNELLGPEDSPFLDHSFLSGLEETGCVSLEKGWQPRFLLACRPGESGLQLVGAVPLYLKKHSEGEFCEEADWIEASWRHKNSHWPRLFVGVPFTPHRGRRLITAAWLPEVERTEVERELLEGLRAISVRTKISVNIGFPTEGEGHTLKDHGFVMRFARQAWWSNRMPERYKDFQDFLRTLRVKRAREIAKQRAELKEAISKLGGHIQVIDGSRTPSAVTPELLSEVFDACYAPTQLKHGNFENRKGDPRYPRFDLTRDFFTRLGERIPHRILLVLARQGEQILGGGLFFIKAGRIYGRYWGCREERPDLPFLHFECCYYAAIEHAIHHGYERIEPGNGGGGVCQVQRRRGFNPVPTSSYHFIPDEALREEVTQLAREAAKVQPSWTVQRNSAYAPKPREYRDAV